MFPFYTLLIRYHNNVDYIVSESPCQEEAAPARKPGRTTTTDRQVPPIQTSIGKRDIPEPSARRIGERLVPVPVTTALKAVAYTKFRDSGQTKVAIAKAMDIKESEVRRILDPRHGTRADTMERFIRSLSGDVLVSAR